MRTCSTCSNWDVGRCYCYYHETYMLHMDICERHNELKGATLTLLQQYCIANKQAALREKKALALALDNRASATPVKK